MTNEWNTAIFTADFAVIICLFYRITIYAFRSNRQFEPTLFRICKAISLFWKFRDFLFVILNVQNRTIYFVSCNWSKKRLSNIWIHYVGHFGCTKDAMSYSFEFFIRINHFFWLCVPSPSTARSSTSSLLINLKIFSSNQL